MISGGCVEARQKGAHDDCTSHKDGSPAGAVDEVPAERARLRVSAHRFGRRESRRNSRQRSRENVD